MINADGKVEEKIEELSIKIQSKTKYKLRKVGWEISLAQIQLKIAVVWVK